jgi:hypothetical protein
LCQEKIFKEIFSVVCWWFTPVMLATLEAEVRRMGSKPTLKIPPQKGAGGVAQAVKCLPRKCEALNLNPSTAKKKVSNVVKGIKLKSQETQ